MKNWVSLISVLLLSVACTKIVKQNEDAKVLEQEEKSEQTLTLEAYLEKRYGVPMEDAVVRFNDGTTLDLKTPLAVSPIKPQSHTFFLGDYLDANHTKTTDAEGVVLVQDAYNITEIARIALFAINSYKKNGEAHAKETFLNQMRYIETHFYEKEFYGFWYFPDASPLYHLEPGWSSVLSQGWLMNACMEAYHLTQEEKWLRLVEKALKAFMVPVANGGFKRMWEPDEVWYEEYGTARPSRVLNGNIFGLESVYNIYKDTGWELAKKIFESGVATLKNHLHDYDAVWTSRYSLADWKNEVAFEHYHEIHVIQMLWLYQVTKDRQFKDYAQRFLENDRQNFYSNTRYALPAKMQAITATHSIDSINYGPENLLDEIWAFGPFWSSNKNVDLIVDLGQYRHHIKGLTLFHVHDKSKDVPFSIAIKDEETSEWEFVQNVWPKFTKDKISVYNETSNGIETYVEHFKIAEPASGRFVRLAFEATSENIIALRHLNFIFDRAEEIDHLEKMVQEHFKIINRL